MSMNQLYDLSKVYLEQIASVDEAVKGQDTEMRKAASAERSAERKEMGGRAAKIPGREGPSSGKTYADYQQISIKSHDKLTKKNKDIVGLVAKEALDPVGQEDADIDNDGKKNTKSDKYLTNRRKVRGAAIKNEGFSNWRQDLSEVMDTVDSPDDENQKEIKEKKIQNKIKINPDFKEAVEEIGGQLIEMVEIEEGYQEIDREKETKMYRRAGNLARTSLSSKGKEKEDARNKSAKIVSAITRQKENERFNRIGQSPAHNEEFVGEGKKEFPHKKVDRQVYDAMDSGETAGDSGNRAKETRDYARADKMRSVAAKYGGKTRARVKEEYVDEGMHKDAETGEVVSKAVPGKTYYPAQPMKKTSVAIEKERKMKNEEVGGGMKKGGSYDKGYEAMKKEIGKLDRGEEPATAKRYREMKKEEFELDEKTLTAAETAKKEQIVKSMKRNLSGFKSRYGERAKEVMYATATKQAKK